MTEQNDQTLSFSERCGQFLTQHRKPIVIILGVICAVVAVALIASAMTTRAAKSASVETEAIISEWANLRDKNAEDMTAKEDALAEKLGKQAVANGHTYAAFRAYTTLGEIYVLRKDWEKALAFYQKAGEALPKAYTAGIAYFKAALEDFPLKPRALFNIGRLEESLAHPDKAIEAYTKLTEAYPDNDWTLLAKSRIIALSIN